MFGSNSKDFCGSLACKNGWKLKLNTNLDKFIHRFLSIHVIKKIKWKIVKSSTWG